MNNIEIRTCLSCGNTKPIDDFKKDKNKTNHRFKCKECTRKYARAWRFNISIEQLAELEKKDSCAICSSYIIGQKNIDHNHTTGEIRDILCSGCNAALGLIKEDKETLEKMIIYIEKWENKN